MKKLSRLLGIVITVLTVVLFLLSSATAYIPPTQFPFATLLSIGYLPILSIYVLVMFCWFFRSKRVFIALLILLFAGYKNLSATIATNIFARSWKEAKEPGTIRVMSWNVNFLGDPFKINDTSKSIRQQILAMLQKTNPDILCLQDLGEKRQTPDGRFVQNVEAILQTVGFTSVNYPFFYEFEGFKHAKLGVAIFTKLPVIDTGSFWTEGASIYERTAFVDVMLQGKPLRIINSHLSSMSLWPSDKQESGINYLGGDSTKTKAKTIFTKVNEYGKIHTREAFSLSKFIKQTRQPVLFCADMNSVPSSFIYHFIKGDMQDAFLEKDFGIGGTYNRVFPKLRIDVMLHSKELEVLQFTRPAVELSDHYPIIADIRWKQ